MSNLICCDLISWCYCVVISQHIYGIPRVSAAVDHVFILDQSLRRSADMAFLSLSPVYKLSSAKGCIW